MVWKNSKYVITLNQLATVIEKCHGWPLADEKGDPVVNTWDVDPTSTVELHELITCQDCKHWRRFWPESKELWGTCLGWNGASRYDGYCNKAMKADGEIGYKKGIQCGNWGIKTTQPSNDANSTNEGSGE